jgi:hypothetical protein
MERSPEIVIFQIYKLPGSLNSIIWAKIDLAPIFTNVYSPYCELVWVISKSSIGHGKILTMNSL